MWRVFLFNAREVSPFSTQALQACHSTLALKNLAENTAMKQEKKRCPNEEQPSVATPPHPLLESQGTKDRRGEMAQVH